MTTYYNTIKSYDVETLALFLVRLIEETEKMLLESINSQGVKVDLCSMATELRVQRMIATLTEEREEVDL